MATRWAWFWLSLPLSVGWLVFTLVEPVILGTDRPIREPARRLTGGRAFLLAIPLSLALGFLTPVLTR